MNILEKLAHYNAFSLTPEQWAKLSDYQKRMLYRSAKELFTFHDDDIAVVGSISLRNGRRGLFTAYRRIPGSSGKVVQWEPIQLPGIYERGKSKAHGLTVGQLKEMMSRFEVIQELLSNVYLDFYDLSDDCIIEAPDGRMDDAFAELNIMPREWK